MMVLSCFLSHPLNAVGPFVSLCGDLFSQAAQMCLDKDTMNISDIGL